MKTLLIKNPLLVATMNNNGVEFSGGHILIEDGIIKSIGPDALDIAADEVIDASGMVITPGFINTHHHLFQTLTRNIPLMQDQPLFAWLKNHYEVWREITTEAIEVSTQVGLLELMKTGVTTSSDHLYLFPAQASPELIDTEIEAAKSLGIRFQPTRGSMSRGHSVGGLPPDDVVTILTTSGNFYISSCVTAEIEKFCKWDREITDQTKVIFVNHKQEAYREWNHLFFPITKKNS